MGLRDVEIKNEYRSLIDNVAKDFYIPLLRQANLYKRAVGFFSSSALIEISKGIAGLVKNGGKIQLIASPFLSGDDVEAMRKGYELREKIIEDALLRQLHVTNGELERDRLNLLSHLIAQGVLDIKIALTENNGVLGMYHEKMGIIADSNGDIVAFSGSMNESATAIMLNYEAIDVFCSWRGDTSRIDAKENAFTAIWNDVEPNIKTIAFPNLKDEIIRRYQTTANPPTVDIDLREFGSDLLKPRRAGSVDVWIRKPADISFYDYQIEAMQNWQNAGYRGIFDMATGTGKTLTALGALEVLSYGLQSRLGIVIVCPYQHLVEQWVDDIKAFGMKPLICYSRYDWKKRFKSLLGDFGLGIVQNFCVITTNATFATDYFQHEIDKLTGDICLVVDEAHNLGATRQLECMKPLYKYRLALSATLERHYDAIGTQKLKDFFGDKCIEYTLERAIKEDKLTPYYYYPIPVYFESDELDDYNELTEKIVKMLQRTKQGEPMPKQVEMLLIKRARIIAGARGKVSALKQLLQKSYLNENNILVYCGATRTNATATNTAVDDEEKRQIESVVNMMGNELGMRVTKFTSEEDAAEREIIKEDFSKGDMLQAVVAIRCLDEGVNIPGIKTAFILASSTNPKEYIQRRGRVLRKAAGKAVATIYDFVTLPRNIDESMYGTDFLNSEYSLIRREYERMEDFARLSENPSEVILLQQKINAYYKLYYIGGADYGI